IHVVSDVPHDFLGYLESKEIQIIQKSTFDTRNKYCNKLVQLETFVNIENFDYVFLMDCDTAVIDLDGLDITNNIYAKIVDFPNPPLSILQDIFAENSLEVSQAETTFPLKGDQLTDWNNCNGGLYI